MKLLIKLISKSLLSRRRTFESICIEDESGMNEISLLYSEINNTVHFE